MLFPKYLLLNKNIMEIAISLCDLILTMACTDSADKKVFYMGQYINIRGLQTENGMMVTPEYPLRMRISLNLILIGIVQTSTNFRLYFSRKVIDYSL